jgi:hypothetical protein
MVKFLKKYIPTTKNQAKPKTKHSESGADIKKSILSSQAAGQNKEFDIFRSVTGNSRRDFQTQDFDRISSLAYHMWKHNGIGRRLLRTNKNFIVGAGVTLGFDEKIDDRAKESLNDHWNDSDNQWPVKINNRVEEWLLYGEQILQAFINPFSGHVKLGSIDPELVKEIIPDKNNAEIMDVVVVKTEGMLSKNKRLKVIREDTDPTSKTFGKLVGDVFLFQINKVLNATRGISKIGNIIDELDMLKNIIIDVATASRLSLATIYDIVLEGAKTEDIQKWLEDPNNSIPPPGSIRAHNEKEVWTLMTADLKNADRAKLVLILVKYIAGTYGYPIHWLSWGDDVNRANAQEMAEPTRKDLESEQLLVKSMLERILTYQLHQKEIRGKIPKGQEKLFSVKMSDISVNDTETSAKSLNSTVLSVSTATALGLMSNETGMQLIFDVARQLSPNIPQIDKEAEKIKNQKPTTQQSSQALADIDRVNQWLPSKK